MKLIGLINLGPFQHQRAGGHDPRGPALWDPGGGIHLVDDRRPGNPLIDPEGGPLMHAGADFAPEQSYDARRFAAEGHDLTAQRNDARLWSRAGDVRPQFLEPDLGGLV